MKEDCIEGSSSGRIGVYSYQGISLPRIVRPEILEALPKFRFRADDIVVITSPKAGTHWVNEICGLILADGIQENVKRETMKFKLEFAVIDKTYADENQPIRYFYQELEKAQSPRLITTHLPMSLLPKGLFDVRPKIIYVARNPKDTLLSYYKFVGDTDESPGYNWNWMLNNFFTNEYKFGAWDQHVIPFWKLRNEANILFLKYEDIKRDPRTAIENIAHHIGHLITDEILEMVVEKTSLQSLKTEMERLQTIYADGDVFGKAMGKYSYYRKGVVGDWKNYFTVMQNEVFDEIYNEKLSGTNLSFDFE